MKKKYNTTELSVYKAIERGIMHRDFYAHAFRWTHIVKNAKIGQKIVDFGSGEAELLETMYRNRYKPKKYIGLDIRESVIEKNIEKYENLPIDVQFYAVDLVKPDIDLKQFNADIVVSNEVIEHVGKQNAKKFLTNFKNCGSEDATYYLSTPNYDPNVGAAGNHTYDSGDGNGVQPQEFDHLELLDLLEEEFEIVNSFGTFASQKDYIEYLTPAQMEVYEQLKMYYDSNLISNIMAPIIESVNARNVLWVLRRKK